MARPHARKEGANSPRRGYFHALYPGAIAAHSCGGLGFAPAAGGPVRSFVSRAARELEQPEQAGHPVESHLAFGLCFIEEQRAAHKKRVL